MEVSHFIMSATTMQFLLLITLGCFETIDSSTPKVWLSEYSYYQGNWEMNKVEVITFPAPESFKTSENFKNDFVSKADNNYVAQGNVSVVFTCEADQPIFWFLSHVELRHLVMPSLNIVTINYRSSSNISKNTFKSLLFINNLDLDDDDPSDDVTDLVKRWFNPRWTFTCSTNENHDHGNCTGDGSSTSISLSLGDTATNYISHHHHYRTEQLKPDDKIIQTVLKIDMQSNNSKDESRKITTIYLDDSLYHVNNSEANKDHIILQPNTTINSDEYVSELDEDGWEHFNLIASPTKLVEYGKEENIVEGDSIQIFCFSLHKFYAFGVYLQVNWKNGTSTLLEEADTEMKGIQVSLNQELIDGHPIYGNVSGIQRLMYFDLLYYLSQSFEAKLEMKSVDCFMPVWKSGAKWEKATTPLKVLPKKHA